MARRSLKPQLNQIRTWVRQGRTDAWIAHQLEVTVKDVVSFKREYELVPGEAAEEQEGPFGHVEDEPDLRAEDDALVAAELDAEPEEKPEEEDEGDKPRRRGRRGGRRRRTGARALEGTFDHGEEGYGLWLDPAVEDDALYAEHWKGHRPVTVTVEADRIVIRRAGEEPDEATVSSGGGGGAAADELDPDAFDA